jgi:hypothetical protein
MKQTAVEWLIEQLENHNGVTREGFEKCIQEAKDMEKEELFNAFDSGTYFSKWENAEQYYFETYLLE